MNFTRWFFSCKSLNKQNNVASHCCWKGKSQIRLIKDDVTLKNRNNNIGGVLLDFFSRFDVL